MIILFSVFLVVQDEEGQVKCSQVMCFKSALGRISILSHGRSRPKH